MFCVWSATNSAASHSMRRLETLEDDCDSAIVTALEDQGIAAELDTNEGVRVTLDGSRFHVVSRCTYAKEAPEPVLAVEN